MIAYAYVGPEDIGEAVRPGGGGARIRTRADLDAFLSARPADELAEPFTFVVDASLTLRLAPRRSEHVACADGKPVRAAGELGFARTSSDWAVTYASNQSTGYCPDPESWRSLAAALNRAGISHSGAHPGGYTHPIVYRRCPSCAEWNSVQDAHFVCALCDADLPADHRTGPMDLALLADEEGNSVRITVLGRHPRMVAGLAAEIVVETPFVRGRLELALWRRRLEAWGHALDAAFDRGEDIAWMTVERGPSISIRLTGERDCPEVIVEDDTISMATVCVPVGLPRNWIDSHRRKLRDVLTLWNPED
ncbi:DUF5959 family protein [Streptomyces phaeochromogenes]|uniref:DUF5959 family protein n=1 Tax=Streptomyces phaeochromogenes TaxID=1923 RepID=UPI0007C8A2B6